MSFEYYPIQLCYSFRSFDVSRNSNIKAIYFLRQIACLFLVNILHRQEYSSVDLTEIDAVWIYYCIIILLY